MTSNHQILLTVSVNVLTNSVYCEKRVTQASCESFSKVDLSKSFHNRETEQLLMSR